MIDPTPILIILAILLLVGAAIAEAKHIAGQRTTRINGWWHYQHPGRHHWMPSAWKNACDQSLEKSRKRRGLD